MTKEEGRKEIIFQMTMSSAQRLLDLGYISREEYIQFDTNMRAKYSPIFGSLFSDIDLK